MGDPARFLDDMSGRPVLMVGGSTEKHSGQENGRK